MKRVLSYESIVHWEKMQNSSTSSVTLLMTIATSARSTYIILYCIHYVCCERVICVQRDAATAKTYGVRASCTIYGFEGVFYWTERKTKRDQWIDALGRRRLLVYPLYRLFDYTAAYRQRSCSFVYAHAWSSVSVYTIYCWLLGCVFFFTSIRFFRVFPVTRGIYPLCVVFESFEVFVVQHYIIYYKRGV